MDLARLKHFYTIVKAGSLSGAGKILNMDHSTLSRSMQLLEHSLKMQLLERTARGVKLTPQGKRVYEFSERFIKEAEIVKNYVNDSAHEPQGDLNIVTTPHMGSSWLMSYLGEYLEKHPKMKVNVIGRMEKVDVTDADVAICPYIPHNPNLVQRHLKSFRMGLWASPEYLEKYGEPKSIEELDHHKIIAYGENIISPYGNCCWILEVGTVSPFKRKPYLQVNNLEGLINAAKNGIGIAELSGDWPSVKDSKLVNILPYIEAPTVDLYYIYNDNMKRSKRITSLADFLESRIIIKP